MTSLTKGGSDNISITGVTQAGVVIDSVRYPVSTTDKNTFAMAITPDKSRLYVGGDFDYAGDCRSAALVDSSGDNVSGFLSAGIHRNGYSSGVYGCLPDGSGGYFLYGSFQDYDNSNDHDFLVYIDSSGNLDDFWTPKPNGNVTGAVIANSLLYFCGNFTEVNGTSRTRLAAVALPASGAATLNAWAPTTTSAPAAMAAVGDQIWVCGTQGSVTGSSGSSSSSIVQIHNSTAVVASNAINNNSHSGDAMSMAVDGTSLYVAGSFINIGGTSVNRVAKITDADDASSAAVDTGYTLSTTSGPNVIITDGTYLWIGGATDMKDSASLYVANLSDASAVSGFSSPDFDDDITALALDGSGALYIGGAFGNVDSSARLNCAKVTYTGGDPGTAALDGSWGAQASAYAAFSPGCTTTIQFMTMLGSNIAFGTTTSTALAGQVYPRHNMAAFDTVTNSVIAAFAPDPNNVVYTIVAEDDYVWFGGSFTSVDSLAVSPITRNRTACYSAAGALQNWTPGSSELNSTVYTMVKKADTDYIIIGGIFTEGLYKYQSNPTTTSPSSDAIAITSNKDVYGASIYGDKVYFCGKFVMGSAYNAAAVDFTGDWSGSGTQDTNFVPMTSGSSIVRAIWRRNHTTHGDYVYIAGEQTVDNSYLSRYSPSDGSYDSGWTPSTGGQSLDAAVGIDYIYVVDKTYPYTLKAFDYVDGSEALVLPPVIDGYTRVVTTGPDMEGMAYGGNKSPPTEGTMSYSFQHYLGTWVSAVTTDTVTLTTSSTAPAANVMVVYGTSSGSYTGRYDGSTITIEGEGGGGGGDPYVRSIMQPNKTFKINDNAPAYLLFRAAGKNPSTNTTIVYTLSATTWDPQLKLTGFAPDSEIAALAATRPTYFRYLAISAVYQSAAGAGAGTGTGATRRDSGIRRDSIVIDLETGRIATSPDPDAITLQAITNSVPTRSMRSSSEAIGSIVVSKPMRRPTKTIHLDRKAISSIVNLKGLNLKLVVGRDLDNPLFRTFVQFCHEPGLTEFRKQVMAGKSRVDGLLWRAGNDQRLRNLIL